MSGWLKTGSASAIILLLTSAKKIAHSPRKLLREKKCSQNLLMENQICSRRINFAHGES
jgi:hypothetical protein